MTIELVLCIVFFLVALPISRGIAGHYLVFAAGNFAFLDVQYADSSLLAILFAALFAIDALLVIGGASRVLLVSAAASALLCLESIANMDWLLSRITYLSAAVNTAIAASLAKEFTLWMRGNYGR